MIDESTPSRTEVEYTMRRLKNGKCEGTSPSGIDKVSCSGPNNMADSINNVPLQEGSYIAS